MPLRARKRCHDMTATPDPIISAETFAANLSDRWLHCRELGHTWRPWGARDEPSSRCYVRTTRCSQCRTERHWIIDYRGHVVSSHYTYPDGYLAKHVEPGYSRDTFRLEAVVREIAAPQRKAVS